MDKKQLLDKIKNHYNLSNNTEFARFLGVSSQVVSNWYSRNTYNINVLLDKCLDINPQWLLTGSGDMLRKQVDAVLTRITHNVSNDVKDKQSPSKKVLSNNVGIVELSTPLDISILLSIIEEKDRKIESQAKELGKLEGKVEYLEEELKKRRENDAKDAHTHDIASVG